jgi:hypothetical protein
VLTLAQFLGPFTSRRVRPGDLSEQPQDTARIGLLPALAVGRPLVEACLDDARRDPCAIVEAGAGDAGLRLILPLKTLAEKLRASAELIRSGAPGR